VFLLAHATICTSPAQAALLRAALPTVRRMAYLFVA